MRMQVMQQSLLHIRFASTGNLGTKVLHEMGVFDSPCGPGIYLPRKVKVEPDLSLLRDKFSVRYECEPSLEIDVNYIKSLFTFHYSAWFFRVFMLLNVFLSISHSLSSESFKKLKTPVVS